jgi:hypothetical protein
VVRQAIEHLVGGELTAVKRRDQVGRRWPGLDLNALDLLPEGFLLDRLEKPLPVLVLVVLGPELSRGELGDQPLGKRPLLTADLLFRAPVDLGRIVDFTREVEPLEEEPVLVHPNRDRGRLAAPRERADATRCVFSSAFTSTRYPRSPFFPAPR